MSQRGHFRLQLPAVIVCGAVLLSCHSAPTGAADSSAANSYVDARQCAACHPKISRAYGSTGMARSFYRPSAATVGAAVFFHRPSGTYYSVAHRDGKFYQRRWRNGYQGKETDVEESAIDFVMGSGNHVRTYLRRTARGALI